MNLGEMLSYGFSLCFEPTTFIMLFVGIILGTIFGALPGVSATMAVTLGIPFTYSMDPVRGIAFLVAIYCASITGGGMTAILFKIPGVPSSAPATFDGYPMAQRGEGGKALTVQLITSALGGLFAALCMFVLSPQLTRAALSFGPSELFAITFLGLSILTSLERDNKARTIISGLLGLFLACIGIDPLLGIKRLNYGSNMLLSGIEMIPVMIGIFAVTEVLKQTDKPKKIEASDYKGGGRIKATIPPFREWWGIKWIIARCAVLGTIVGILPGAGATIASFLCYSTEVKLSRHPEKFGTGIIDGIAACETANNAATGGSMVPLLSLGIPGGNAAAIMMSAMVLKGVQMGPLLLINQPEFLAATFSSMAIANILMVIVAIFIARIFAKILDIPYSVLGPTIIMLATIGSFATKFNIADVKLMAIAGIIGFVLVACKFNAAALILGLVLGNLCETNLRRAVTIANGNTIWSKIVDMMSRPVTGLIMLACFIMLIYPVIKDALDNRRKSRQSA